MTEGHDDTGQTDRPSRAIELWDKNGRGVTSDDMAARFGVDEESAKREQLPLVVEYLKSYYRGDGGVAVVRQQGLPLASSSVCSERAVSGAG